MEAVGEAVSGRPQSQRRRAAARGTRDGPPYRVVVRLCIAETVCFAPALLLMTCFGCIIHPNSYEVRRLLARADLIVLLATVGAISRMVKQGGIGWWWGEYVREGSRKQGIGYPRGGEVA
jgi:hypothetical protein